MKVNRAPKGHRLVRSWRGAADSYANGRCECGVWVFDGWTEHMRDVIRQHRQHCDRVLRGKPEFHRHGAQQWVQQIPAGPYSVVKSTGEPK